MKILFKKGEWESKLQYAYTYRFPEKPLFKQEEDCLVNLPNPDMPHGYDYVTLMTREKYPLGTVFGATCSFHAYGAPLLVITDGLTRDETGAIHYENYYEVVLWEQGIYVWEMKTENKKVTWKKLMGASFPVEREALHSFWVELAPPGHRDLCGRQAVLLAP